MMILLRCESIPQRNKQPVAMTLCASWECRRRDSEIFCSVRTFTKPVISVHKGLTQLTRDTKGTPLGACCNGQLVICNFKIVLAAAIIAGDDLPVMVYC